MFDHFGGDLVNCVLLFSFFFGLLVVFYMVCTLLPLFSSQIWLVHFNFICTWFDLCNRVSTLCRGMNARLSEKHENWTSCHIRHCDVCSPTNTDGGSGVFKLLYISCATLSKFLSHTCMNSLQVAFETTVRTCAWLRPKAHWVCFVAFFFLFPPCTGKVSILHTNFSNTFILSSQSMPTVSTCHLCEFRVWGWTQSIQK